MPNASASADSGDPAAAAQYIAALETLLNTHMLPDGTDCGFDESADPGANRFAVTDIDGDGANELIIEYTTTVTAGQVLAVYAFDSSTGLLRAELVEYPSLTFYDNGVVKADWSHNQGLAGSFWPYTLYRYDPAADSYVSIGMVDAWEKSFAAVDANGNPFPDDIDTSGTGCVYYIMTDGAYDPTDPVDYSVYEQWYDDCLGGAAEVPVAYTALTTDAIESLR